MPPTDAPPDWPTFAGTLPCPLCGYDLRGLATPRCPECGFAFAWAELVSAATTRHRWLFEHGRRRNVRTFAGTYVRTPFPWRFWRSVTPAHPVHVGRVVAYWLLASLPLVAVVAAGVPGRAVELARRNAAGRAQYRRLIAAMPPAAAAAVPVLRREMADRYPAPWSPAFAARVARTAGREVGPTTVAAVAVAVAWPWLSAAALLVFAGSMRRAGVGPAHVARAAVYSCDFGLLVLAVAAAAYCPVQRYSTSLPMTGFSGVQPAGPVYVHSYGSSTPWAARLPLGPVAPAGRPIAVVVVACCAVATVRLSVAYARYLRFDRPVLTVVAAQAVVVLFVAVVLARTVRLF